MLERIAMSAIRHSAFTHRGLRLAAMILLIVASCGLVLRGGEVDIPVPDPTGTIRVRSDEAGLNTQGSYRVYSLKGHCRLTQGSWTAESEEAVIWVDDSFVESDRPIKCIVYMEGNVRIRWSDNQQFQDRHWMGRLHSYFPIDVQTIRWVTDVKEQPLRWEEFHSPELLDRSKPSDVRQAQFEVGTSTQYPTTPNPTSSQQGLPPTEARSGGTFQLPQQGIDIDGAFRQQEVLPLPQPLSSQMSPGQATSVHAGESITSNQPSIGNEPPLGARSFTMTGRTSQEVQLQVIQRPEQNDSIAILTRGFRIRIGGVRARMQDGSIMDVGTVILEADRAVIWTQDFSQVLGGSIGDQPMELYLEGNIVFQQGQRVIYADRMYYNVQREYGMVLSAEVLTPTPQFEGLLRLKADVIEQRSRSNFVARDAALTSSRLGVPRYWLQASRIEVADERMSFSDPFSDQPTTVARPGGTDMEATARNNFVYLGGLPVLYWPVLSTNIEEPNFYINGFKIKNDGIFGTQVMLDWDLYQLLGIDGPNGTSWTLSTDYLSNRGPAVGTNYIYDVPGLLFASPAAGYLDFWGIKDRGRDVLGRDRNGLVPEKDWRGRFLYRHRQYLSKDWEMVGEVGWISDRNFLEQYFEREWDQEKDYTTGLRLRRYNDNRLLDIWGQARINKFFLETEWLPRIDHYWLGQSLFDRFTWHAHSHVGYAHQRPASTPLDAQDAATFTPLPWEADTEGVRVATRQELSMPFSLGVARIVPFLSGEAAHWGEDLTGNSLTRLTGQAGVRSSIPMWAVYPNVESRLLDIRGLAHKVTLKSEFFYADTNQNLDRLPLYDPLDDNSQEHFRRRMIFNTFAGSLPDQFDSRAYAIRQGLQRYVTASSAEVVEDQMQWRIGINQRWQTKRGRRERDRITDLVEFDAGFIFFPKPDRDNFGEDVGAFNYDFRYHIGDRVTLLSDGYADVFSQGLKAITVGTLFSRPGEGEWYTGFTSLEGPISSFVLHSNINYRLSEKWIVSGGTAVDLGNVGNIGQNIAMTRIGESFLLQVGASVDSGRDNIAFTFNVEPRFLSRRRLGAVGGMLIPPAGIHGLE